MSLFQALRNLGPYTQEILKEFLLHCKDIFLYFYIKILYFLCSSLDA